MSKLYIIVLCMSLISGCTPFIERSQPTVKVIVLDEKGNPLDDAIVVLKTTLIEGKTTYTYQSQKTSEGVAFFDKKINLTLRFKDIDRKYFHSVCVSMKGYENQYALYKEHQPITIHLNSIQNTDKKSVACFKNE